MKRPLVSALLAPALLVGLLAAPSSALAPGFDCGPDDGRERLTAEGFHLEFQAPGSTSTGHDIVEFAGQEYPRAASEHATAHFPFRLFTAPATSATLRISVDWAGQGDFDLDIYDAEGNPLGDGSHSFNPVAGNGEEVTLGGVAHCTDLTVAVQNYMGNPDETLTLDIEVTPGEEVFACEADDSHPACEGKLEGEAPAVTPDSRTRLYLGGDRPGQVAMWGHYVYKTAGQGDAPIEGRLEPGRPLGGNPNSYTHLVTGNPETNQNPFMAHFTTKLAEPIQLSGDVQALLWLSSRTLGEEGKLFVDLYADSFGAALGGTRLARVEVPGSAVGAAPAPVAVTFQDLEALVEDELTLQVASPRANDGNDPQYLEWTVHYGSVQFPSSIALDLPQGALPSSE